MSNSSLGTIWQIADSTEEAEEWARAYKARGGNDVLVVIKKPDVDGKVTVLVTLHRSRASEILGYDVEECEFLEEDQDGAVSLSDQKKYAVTYTLRYLHVVTVGIRAPSERAAICLAERMFAEGTIWDDTPDVPMLYDDYEEQDGPLEFEATEVAEWPEAAHCVVYQRQQALAKNIFDAIAKLLVDPADAQSLRSVHELGMNDLMPILEQVHKALAEQRAATIAV